MNTRRILLFPLTTLVLLPAVTHASGNAGSLDESFGTNGEIITDVHPNCSVMTTDVAVQSDDKIIAVAGCFLDTLPDLFVTRYLPDGEPDDTFGEDSISQIDLTYGNGEYPVAVKLQSTEKIVIAAIGQFTSENLGSESEIAVIRLNEDGSLDDSFGIDGVSTVSFGNRFSEVTSMAIQSDNKIVLAGRSIEEGDGLMAIARLDADGGLDNTFGQSGIITSLISDSSRASDVLIDTNNNIVVAGSYSTLINGEPSDSGVVLRYSPAGELDATFGFNGVTSNLNIYNAVSISLQSTGHIIVGSSESFVLRLTPNGGTDSTFGASGRSTVEFEEEPISITRVKVLDNDRIAVLGRYLEIENGTFTHYLATTLLSEDGDIDATSGSDGVTITDGTGSVENDRHLGLAIQQDDKFVISARASGGLFVARYRTLSSISSLSALTVTKGQLDPGFNPATTTYTLRVPHSTTSVSLTATTSDPDSRITINGQATTSGEGYSLSSLNVGNNNISIVVSAVDGASQTSYQVSIIRETAIVPVTQQPIDSPKTVKPLRKSKKTKLTTSQLLKSINQKQPKGSQATVSIHRSSKKVCTVTKGKVVPLAKGTCRTLITIQPKPTKTNSKPKLIKHTVYVIIT